MLLAVSVLLTIIFVLVYIIIFSAKEKAKKLAPLILDQRRKNKGSVKFEHYFLANTGIFVEGVMHRPAMLLYSSAYSFCGMIALILAVINFFSKNYVLMGIMLLITGNVFFSKTGSWFPHANQEICLKRAIANYAQKYPDEVGSVPPLTLLGFYDEANEISEMFFWDEVR